MKKHLRLSLAALSLLIIPLSRANAQEITQEIITVAGLGTEGLTVDSGSAVSAALNWPSSVAIDRKGNLYIADMDNNIVRKVSHGIITTVAGNGFGAGRGYGNFSGDGGPATAATLYSPSGVAVDTLGRLFIADQWNNCIREVDTSDTITTVAGTGGEGNFAYMGDGGAATAAYLYHPTRIAVDTFGNIYIADNMNNAIREVTFATGIINTIAGTGVGGYSGDGAAASLAQVNLPRDVAVDFAGNVYIADMGNSVIREIATNDTIYTIAGTGISGFSGDGGPATAADLFQPSGIAVDDSGNIFFSDLGNSDVRRIGVNDTISTLAGIDTPGFNGDDRYATTAELWYPEGLAATGYDVYIADRGNFRVRELIPAALAVKNVNAAQESIVVYPNPTWGTFTININSSLSEQVQIVISNLTGEQLNTTDAVTNRPLSITLNQPPGMYFISAVTAHGVLNEKLIIN